MPSIVAGRGQVALGAEELECVAQLLQSRFGFRLAEIQERNLKEAVRERMRRLGCAHGTDYVCELLGSPADGGELGELVSEYTNTETHFFRHRGRFELLCARVVPAVVERKRRSGGPIRVLSAGCSTGDEVYSIVMSLWPLRPAWCELGLEVVGCDINERALAKARQACYGSWPLRFTPSQVKAELFVPRPGERGLLQVDERVRGHASFRRANLVDPKLPDEPGMGGFDAIFCCNVIIYLDEPATARLLDNLWRMLEPEGFLFLGYTENLPGLRQIYDRVSSQDYVAYRKPGPSCPARTEWSAAAPEQRPARPTPSAKPVPALAVARPGPEPGKSVAQRCELARQHCLADRHGAAMEAVEGILAQSPQCARARLLKGYLLTGRGERAAAIEECVKVLDVDPLRAEAHLLLGMLLEQAGDAEDAVGEVRKALYLEPGLALAHYTLGKLRAGQGERDEAVRAFAEAIRVLHARPDAAVAAELPVELGPRALMDLAEQHLTRLALGGPVP